LSAPSNHKGSITRTRSQGSLIDEQKAARNRGHNPHMRKSANVLTIKDGESAFFKHLLQKLNNNREGLSWSLKDLKQFQSLRDRSVITQADYLRLEEIFRRWHKQSC